MWTSLADAALPLAARGLLWLAQTAALLALALLAGHLLRRRGPAAQSLIYRTALAAALLVPAATSGFSRLGVVAVAPVAPVPPLRPDAAGIPIETDPVKESASEEMKTASVLSHEGMRPSAPVSPIDVGLPTLLPAPPPPPPLTLRQGASLAMVSVWLCGSAILLARLSLGIIRMRAIRAASRSVEAETGQLASDLATSSGVEVPAILRSPFIASPCLDGWIRPAILLPEGPDDPDELRDTLAHELAHLARGDHFWGLAREFALAVLWPQPLLWRLRRCMEVTAEQACDDLVLRHGGDRVRYADHLLRLAARHAAPPAPTVVGMISVRSMLGRRVERILGQSVPCAIQPSRRAIAASLALGLSATLGIGVLSARPATPPPVIAPPAVEVPEGDLRSRLITDGPYRATVEEVTVEGKATDHQGNPVADADVRILDAHRYMLQPPLLGRTRTGADGSFRFATLHVRVLAFPDERPVPSPEARIEVSALAKGHAYTWRAEQRYRPLPRPAGEDAAKDPDTFYKGEPIRADLKFSAPARLSGRLTDDRGEPIAGAKILVGLVPNVINPFGYPTDIMHKVEPKRPPRMGFRGMQYVPESLRSAVTGPDGRYVFAELPREAEFVVSFQLGPSFGPEMLRLATTDQRLDSTLSVGYDGTLDRTFTRLSPVRVIATRASDRAPLAGAIISARRSSVAEPTAFDVWTRYINLRSEADANGEAVLWIAPDSYVFRVEPKDADRAVATEQRGRIEKRPDEARVAIAAPAAGIVTFEVVDATSGRPVEGIRFESLSETTFFRNPVSSQTVFTDRPATGPDGRLVALLRPDSYKFFPIDPMNRGVDLDPSDRVTLGGAESRTVRFSIKSRPAKPARPAPPDDPELRRLAALWDDQNRLLERGRHKGSRTFLGGPLNIARITEWLNRQDRDKVPDLEGWLRREFPGRNSWPRMDLTLAFDGRRAVQDWTGAGGTILLFNGVETLNYARRNGQLDIDGLGKGRGAGRAIPTIRNYISVPRDVHPILRREGGTIRIGKEEGGFATETLVSAGSGFVHYQEINQGNGAAITRVWQFAPRTVAPSLPMPAIRIEIQTSGDHVQGWVNRTDSLDLSTPIPTSTFSLALPPGVSVFEPRDGEPSRFIGMTSGPVTDILTLLNERTFPRSGP